jgi:anti-sigma factor RsiW
MAKLTDEIIERYYDGELSPKKAKWVESQLEGSTEHQKRLERMSRMSGLLHLMEQESLSGVSFAGFEERVKAGIRQGEKPGIIDRAKVWASEFFEHRQLVWIPSAVVVTAVLAVLIASPFMAGPPTSPQKVGGGNEIWTASDAAHKEAPSSAIMSVNFGEATGERYDVPNANGGTVGVVWIVERPK